jgi:hypothetical protein
LIIAHTHVVYSTLMGESTLWTLVWISRLQALGWLGSAQLTYVKPLNISQDKSQRATEPSASMFP